MTPVFISYSRKDTDFVEQLACAQNARAMGVIYDWTHYGTNETIDFLVVLR